MIEPVKAMPTQRMIFLRNSGHTGKRTSARTPMTSAALIALRFQTGPS